MLVNAGRLEPVADCLVQEDAAEAVPHHHREPPRRGVDGVEHGEGLARRALGDPLGRVLEQLPAGVAAEGVRAGLDAIAAARHDLGAEPQPGAIVGGRAPVGAEDLHPPAGLRVADPDLRHVAAGATGGLVAGAQQLRLGRRLDLLRPLRDRVPVRRLESRDGATESATRRRSSSARPST